MFVQSDGLPLHIAIQIDSYVSEMFSFIAAGNQWILWKTRSFRKAIVLEFVDNFLFAFSLIFILFVKVKVIQIYIHVYTYINFI